MTNTQAVCYLLGVIALFLAGVRLRLGPKASLPLLGAALLALGYTLPAINHLFA